MGVHRRGVLTSAALIAGGAAASGASAAAGAPLSGQKIEISGTGSTAFVAAVHKIAAFAALHRKTYGLPGLTLVCTGPNGITASIRTGYADRELRTPVSPDHLFQIGSISKSFVAMAIHQLAQEGKLKLADDIRTALPGVALPPAPPISLMNLMEHSSGLPDDAPLFPHTPDGLLWSAFPPGSAWSYSNTGYDLLGKVVERMDKISLAQSLKRRIFEPLGMASARGEIIAAERQRYPTGYTPLDPAVDAFPGGRLAPAAWVNVTFGAGCVAATARDMAHWLRYLAQDPVVAGRLLPPDAATAYFRPGIAAPGWASEGARYGAGLAHVPIEGRTLLHHTGGMVSFSSSLHVDPIAKVGAFASTNSGGQEYRPRDLTAYACALLRSVVAPEPGFAPKPKPEARLPRPKAAPVTETPDPALIPFAGRYESDDPWRGAFDIAAGQDGLIVDGDTRLVRHADGYWTLKVPVSTERIWFGPELDGRRQTLSFSGVDYVRRDL